MMSGSSQTRSGTAYGADAAPSFQAASHPSSSNAVASTLLTIKSMLETTPPSTPFEINATNCINLLISQMVEMKHEQEVSNSKTAGLMHVVRDIEVSTIKTEQYSRRDCITVTGVSQAAGETRKDLGQKVASVLSKSGTPVKVDDLSAFHRNGGKGREVNLHNGTKKFIPPSVTVKFKAINQKDDVLRNYKNYDSSKSKRMDIQVYQSLSSHYAELRRSIIKFFETDGALGKQVKWVRYLSPTSGIGVKLKSEEFMKYINTMDEFLFMFKRDVVPAAVDD